MTDISVGRIDRLQLSYSPRPWAFADARRAEIDAYFAALRRKNPALWNGRVLLLHEFEIADQVFDGAFFETDFASFVACRDWDFPAAKVWNCFAMGALRSADGAFILGVMGPQTANAGLVYFPSGTPDRSDIVGASVDLAGSVLREVAEETGLTPKDFVPEQGWVTVLAGPRIAHMKVLQAQATAAELYARIRGHLAQETQPELAGVHIAHGPADFHPAMPPFVTAFLAHMWR